MPQLHLLGIVSGSNLRQFLSATDWDSPYRDLVEIVRKQHSHRVIFTTSTQKLHNANGIIFWAKMTILIYALSS